MSNLLLRTLAVCRLQQSESIEGCSRYGVRKFDEVFGHWSAPSLVKCRITYLGVTLRELENLFGSLLMTMLDGQHNQSVFSEGCPSDSKILGALQTVETVDRTQRHRVGADKFPIFSVGWTIWIPVDLSSGLS